MHIELLRSWGARVAGITLLIIGVMGIKEASEIPAPCVALEGADDQAGILDSSLPMKSGKEKLEGIMFVSKMMMKHIFGLNMANSKPCLVI